MEVNFPSDKKYCSLSLKFRIQGTHRLLDGALLIISARFDIFPRSFKRYLKEYDETIIVRLRYPDLSLNSRLNCRPVSALTDEILGNIFDLNEMTKGRVSVRSISEHYYIGFGEEVPRSTI